MRKEARKAPPLHILSYAEMEAMPEPEWLVEGLIQKRSTALMFGKSNSFKSFLAIDIGCSVSTGQPWHGGRTAQGKVLFVATEGSVGVGRLRIPTWFDYHSMSIEERENVHLFPREIRLDVVDDVSALISSMASIGTFALVVVDIFGGSMAGSEIEDKTARAWVHGIQRILRETGAAILTVAHTGWQDDTRARMHTHFWGSFDSRMRVEGDKEALTSTLTIERHKDADSTGQWGFRMTTTGGSLVPVLDDAVKPSKTSKLSVKQRTALDALDDALVFKGVTRQGTEWPPCKVVLVEHWRSRCYTHGIADKDTPEARKKAFQRIRNALQDKGIVRIYDEHVWRCF
ncbi:hypothetical protein BSQ44_24040 [Aquibium oceanicum]|uniref:AAA family ATPase n=2 Tax=Aquibium oceanicum TaxID=1670800 RepID=A0A1L3SXM1_9HYPH|nr:hypothetical protein BSQ44_24040 [Aquibium oceanicum]